MSNKVIAIILASGSGERLGYHLPKQFIKIAGKTVLEHTIDTFENHSRVDDVVIVVNPLFRTLAEEILLRNHYTRVRKLLNGGATRKESSSIGVAAARNLAGPNQNAKLLIHDAVRPFLSEQVICDCIDALERFDAVDTAIPAADTIIQINDDRNIDTIPERKWMYRGQTPQAFRLETIQKAHVLADAQPDQPFTDDCGIVVHFDICPVHVVNGEEKNIKITFMEDVYMADKLFQLRAVEMVDNDDALELANRVVVVFGASKGIGKSICALAMEQGAVVEGFHRSNGVDICDFVAVENALATVRQKHGRIDFVINTAGVLRMGKIEEREMSDVLNEVAVNYTAAVHIVQAAVPYLRESKGGILLFTSSSYTRGRALYSIYSSTKAAIVNFVQAISEELMDANVRINAINPERTATPMRFENFGKEPKDSLLSPEKVAEVSLHTLMSAQTGQVIYVTRENGS